jgi:hypothetical protein
MLLASGFAISDTSVPLIMELMLTESRLSGTSVLPNPWKIIYEKSVPLICRR